MSEECQHPLQEKFELKWEIYKRERGKCFYCDMKLKFKKATIDHIKPKSYGGELSKNNTVIACYTCNQKRGNMPADIFLTLKMTGGLRPT